MGFDEKSTLVFHVARGKDNKWNVNETGFDNSLASFDNEKDAQTYANDLAKAKPGSKIVVEGGSAATR
ncbi:MAG: DUF2188 domain-containing protein [Gammaproteobacteria bacterium]